jgi:hypothetical protein
MFRWLVVCLLAVISSTVAPTQSRAEAGIFQIPLNQQSSQEFIHYQSLRTIEAWNGVRGLIFIVVSGDLPDQMIPYATELARRTENELLAQGVPGADIKSVRWPRGTDTRPETHKVGVMIYVYDRKQTDDFYSQQAGRNLPPTPLNGANGAYLACLKSCTNGSILNSDPDYGRRCSASCPRY